MSDLLGAISPWTGHNNARPNFSEAVQTGPDRTFNLFYAYQLPETNDASDMQATYGGIAATVRQVMFTGVPSGTFTLVWFCWDEAALTDGEFTGSQVVVNGNTTPLGHSLSFWTQNTASVVPFISYDPVVYPVTTEQFYRAQFNGQAGLLQVVPWFHGVTSNRTFATDPNFNEHSNGTNVNGFTCSRGLAWQTGGFDEFKLELTSGTDSNPTWLMGVQFAPAVPAGLTVQNVNGDNIVRTDNVQTEQLDNRMRINCQNAQDVHTVLLDGILQGTTQTPPGEETLEIIDNGGGQYVLLCDLVFAGPPDMAYGTKADGLVLQGDAGGDVTHTVQYLPIAGNAFNVVAGYGGWTPLQRNAFDGLDLSNNDQYEWTTISSEGHMVVVNQDGTYTIDGGGIGSQFFSVQGREKNNGDRWSGMDVVQINTHPVIVDVDGATLTVGSQDLGNTSIPINGANLGHQQLDYKVWLTPSDGKGARPDLPNIPWALLVEQTIENWTDTVVTVANWDVTGLPFSTYYSVILGRRKP